MILSTGGTSQYSGATRSAVLKEELSMIDVI
ncbi:hypothetical protein NRS6110_03578 [Bacillus subtilis]|nr:hypothetical protein BSn5_15435 [Bacillus subtilis BSn5]AOL96505.1 hypothetical protein BS16045_00766 [Bacillus subtilis]EXF51880.1 hypothetical protein Y647_19540 [Bacillus subtilis QH-1]TDO85077.1 hypothetical protein BDW29_4005 [Bacillus sp. AtDRG31]OAZ71050.1 hypothetical protein SRCM101280_00876 [Bacillus subtilis]